MRFQKHDAPKPAHDAPRLDGVRALILDDNRSHRMILGRRLSRRGIQSEDTGSAAEALELILREPSRYQVALVDLQMPGMDGLEFARALHEQAGAKIETKLILLAPFSQRGTSEQALKEGFAAVLSKPVREWHLLNTVAGVLEARDNSAESLVGLHKQTTITVEPQQPAQGGHILIAEDNLVNQKVALRLAEKLGVKADVACNGLDALTALRARPYDLVLMDCQMPEMDGFETTVVIRKLQATGKLPHFPIIAMTANAMQGDRERCLAIGMDDYLSKPVKPENLKAILERWRKPVEAIAVGT